MNLKSRLGKGLAYRAVFWDMSLKQLKSKYSGSFLGLWWAVIIPLLVAASINFVFAKAFRIVFEHFTFFVLSGMIPWFFFSSALIETTNSFTQHGSELRQNIFPRELIPWACVVANFLNFLIGLVFLLPLFFLITPKLIFALPSLILLLGLYLLFVMGIGIFFATLNVFFRDVTYMLSVVMMVWFWVTPVFYKPEMLALKWHKWLYVNPMTSFIVAFHQILFEGNSLSLAHVVPLFASALFFLVLGYGLFLKAEPQLLKRI